MHAMKIYARRENVRVARQAQRRQISAVRSAPQTDPLLINIVTVLQVLRTGYDVLIFGSTARAAMRRQPKRPPIADAAAIVHRQNHVAAADQILILGIRVVIVIAIVPAQKHFAHRPAMHENDCRQLA